MTMNILDNKKIIDALRCPLCGEKMRVRTDASTSIVCVGKRTHCYDVSASGYVNLCAPPQSGGGDSKSAVRSRTAFLDSGYYEPVARALKSTCEKYSNKENLLIDAGCGEGYYSSFFAESGFPTFGIDLSKFAADAAAKRSKRCSYKNIFFATASVFEIPVFDGTADVVTNIFAPCAENEFKRVLKDNGVLVVAYAGEEHLLGLKEAIYENARVNDGRADLPTDMTFVEETRVKYSVTLDSTEKILNLFAMTPYYWKTSVSDAEKLKNLDRLTTDVDIIIAVYRK